MLSLIVAMDRAGAIGRDNALPWHLPADLAWFRRHTLGKPVLMGRRTFDSIGRPLPGRANLVVTRNRQWRQPGCEVFPDLPSALAAHAGAAEIMVIGGAQVYAAALESCERMYVTHVDADVGGDVFFPPLDYDAWRETSSESRRADDRNAFDLRFAIYQRARGP